MKWFKSFFFIFFFAFASNSFAEPPKLDALKKILVFLKNDIKINNKWEFWARQESAVTEEEGFLWDTYVSEHWDFQEETLTLESCEEKLRLFQKKRGVDRWDRDYLTRVIKCDALKALLDNVGVRAATQYLDGKQYDCAIIPGDVLLGVESKLHFFLQLREKRCVNEFILAGSDRKLRKEDKKNKLASKIVSLIKKPVSYDTVAGHLKTEMDGMFFLAMLAVAPDIGDFDSIFGKSAIELRNGVFHDNINAAFGQEGYLSESMVSVQKTGMKISYAKVDQRGRATIKDNVATIYNDDPSIVRKKLILLSSQPCAHYQEEMFKKEFKELHRVSKNGEINVDITVFSPPIGDNILFVEQLDALHQWLKVSLASMESDAIAQ
ncbi:MAG: hypothetical protein QS721_06685 [Candidatus Endonucleobacter sp. (ex Gigantidas childressi)]|nr:hypothetical protein [Candidatus Endonucleobacter sp. (ex Gigantidas childressi)]